MSTPLEKERLDAKSRSHRRLETVRALFVGAAMGNPSGGLFGDGRFLGLLPPLIRGRRKVRDPGYRQR
jgi:hypothetical protein